MPEDSDIARVILEHAGLSAGIRHDGINLFTFKNFGRSTVEAYVAFVRALGDKLDPYGRNLFDLRAAGLPSQYLWEMTGTLYDGIIIPKTVKNALLINPVTVHNVLMRRFAERLTDNSGTNRIFDVEHDAVAWLNGLLDDD